MESPRAYWPKWADFLRQRGLQDVAIWLLEAGGPLALIGAQVLYIGQPFMRNGHLNALANLLEDYDESQAFAAFMREDLAS
jgi:hypothetical protein